MTSKRPAMAARCRCIALIVSFAATSPLLRAQAAPAAATAPTAEQLARYDANKNGRLDPDEIAAMQTAEGAKTDAIMLNPFEVSTSADRGYFAGNTLSGGRADTPLKITPASISVMTKEFLEDFNLTDMNEALAWTVGANAAEGGESGAFGGNRFQTSFRGVDGGGNFPVRNGSINYYVADTYNTERMDFSRGPNAALFGDGGPGGLQGSTSKQARLRTQSTEVAGRVDSYGGYRGTFDTNYGLDRFAVRLNLLHQNNKPYQEVDRKQNGLTVMFRYQISDRTFFRTEIQRDAEKNVVYRRSYGEQASRWNRTTVSTSPTTALAAAAVTAAGLESVPTNERLIWNTSTNSLMNYQGLQLYRTVGLGYQIPPEGMPGIPNFHPGIPGDYVLGPVDHKFDRDFNAQSYWLNHRFARDLHVELGIVKNDGDPFYDYTDSSGPSDYRIDVNERLPNGSINPNFLRPYSDFAQNFQYQQDRVREYKMAAAYLFRAPRLLDWTQRLNFNAGWRRTTFEAKQAQWRWANNPNPALASPNNQANQLRYRVYWGDPRPSIGPATPPTVPGMDWQLVETGGNINQRTIIYGQLVSQSTFLNERIALTGSFRRDKIEGDFFNRIGNDPVTFRNIGGFNGVAGAHLVRTKWRSSPNGGIVVYPFKDMKNQWLAPLGFVANYSANFLQIGSGTTPLISGEDPPLTHAETKDWGLRYAMGDGIAYITLSRYNTNQENRLDNWGTRTDFQNLYTALGYTDPLYTTSSGFSFQDVSSRKLEGWEAEVNVNIGRNISLLMNYSHPLVYTIFESRDRRAFLEANRAYYDQAMNAAVNTEINGRRVANPDLVRTSVQAIDDSLNGTTAGTLSNNLERHRINVAGSYRFTEGRFRGLGLNAGFNYRGYRKVGSRDPRIKFNTSNPTVQQTAEAAYDYLWASPTLSTSAGANYTRRFGKYSARFQVNITNVLNERDPTWNGFSVIQAGQLQNMANANALTVPGGNPRMQVRSGWTPNDPRKISFTTTLKF